MIRLDPSQYGSVRPLVAAVPFNTLFAQVVVEGAIPGDIFVDNPIAPSACLVLHPYGMGLLCGDFTCDAFNTSLRQDFLLKKHNRPKYLLAHPDPWNRLIRDQIPPGGTDSQKEGDRIIEDVRLNFTFDPAQFRMPAVPSPVFQVVSLTPALFNYLEGAVVPKHFWRSSADYAKNGMGYCLTTGIEIVSYAFCAYRVNSYFELGVETDPRFRARGLSVHACAALIDHCLKNRLEPIWGCRLSNEASAKLAAKLGFVQTGIVPYFRLMTENR